MKNFKYYNPTKIIFGKDTISQLGKEISRGGQRKVLLHYGRSSIFKNGVYDQVTASLKEYNIEYFELGGVQPNPRLNMVEEGVKVCVENNIDAIVPIGGGSVYDSAKAIALGSMYDGDVWDFYSGKAVVKEALPIYGVLTLSATGSEMNGNSVITKEDEYKKWATSGAVLFPRISIIDPTVQFTLPKRQTINGAVDIITHVQEFYFDNTPGVDIMQEYSEGIIRTILKETEVLLEAPDNYGSRAQFAWAATLALNTSNATGRSGGDWSSHKIEHSLSAYYDVDHGAGLSIIFPAWAMYVLDENPKLFARFAEKIFNIKEGSDKERAIKGIEALRNFYREIGSPVTLKEIGIKKDNLDKIADNVALLGAIGSIKRLERDDVRRILDIAYE